MLNFLLITVLLSLGVSHTIARGLQILDYTGNFPALFELFLWLAGNFLVVVGVNFFVARLFYQEPITFLESFDRIFAPASIAIYLSVALLLFSFVVNAGTIALFFILFCLVLLLLNLSFYGNIWLTEDQTQQKNRYYVSLVAVLLQWGLTFLVSWIFLSMVLEKVGSNLESIFNQFTSF